MEKFEEFYQALIDEGFADSPYTIWCLFNDEAPDKQDTPWSEGKVIFDKLCKEYGCEYIEQGDEGYWCHGVIKVGDTYYKTEWNYTSYGGYSYDNIRDMICEVKPITTYVTIYE